LNKNDGLPGGVQPRKPAPVIYSSNVKDDAESLVPAIDRALTVFEMLAASNKGLTLSQIARNLGVARSSTFYILNTLAARGYVQRSAARGRYAFTPKLFALANNSVARLQIRERAAPFLRSLMERTGLTVHLTMLSQNELMLIDRYAPAKANQLATWIGKRMPVHCTGAGKALLAYLPPQQVEALIRPGLIRYNENTIVSPAKLRQELHRIRTKGFAVDDEEETIGLRCVGAALLDEAREPVGAISVAGTIEEVNDDALPGLAVDVAATARAISGSGCAEIAVKTRRQP
jgi:DNA-binding IclR family transcriptional regulator